MSDNAHQKPDEPTSLQEILQMMYKAGQFETAILASQDGLLIATEPPGYDSEITAAVVALLRKISHDAQQQLGMAALDEMSIYDRDRSRLVCRYLSVGEQDLILAVMVRENGYYRRVTNWGIKRIERLLS